MLSKPLFARLLMTMPLVSALVTVNSSVVASIVCVEKLHRVKSRGCADCATGRHKSKPKRIATPFHHLLIIIMLASFFSVGEIY